jgi:hypothetical protein
MTEPREHVLISRVVDGDADDREWLELESLASRDPQLWRELALAQRDQTALARAMADVSAVAEGVALPQRQQGAEPEGAITHIKLNRLGAWTGWAVAAAVALVSSIQLNQNAGIGSASSSGSASAPQRAGFVPFTSSADAFQAYLAKGRESGDVIGEVPTKVLLKSRVAPSGDGYEVVFLRQVMERAVVPDLYQLQGQNELGQPTLARYEQPVRSSM